MVPGAEISAASRIAAAIMAAPIRTGIEITVRSGVIAREP